jgi:serine protease Do
VIALASVVVGMVIASRLDLTPSSLAATLRVPATNSAPITGVLDATTFRTIAHDQGPAVVSIWTTGKRQVEDLSDFFGLQQPFGRRGGRGGSGGEETVQGAGSGFIIDSKAGYILTNNHVVDGADAIEVQLADMGPTAEKLSAKLIGHDKLTDSALIQLTERPKEPLAEVKFGDSGQMAAGDWVMAIGNPFTFANTVTVGVVSAVGRVAPGLNPVPNRDLEYIQTDAAINRGNSGGPLLNIRGEVIGINTAIVSDNSNEGNIGIGFAVPINTIKDVLPQLRTGKVTRGRIGIYVSKIPMTASDAKALGLPSPTGAVVSSVENDGPAKTAGIRAGDVVVDFNGKPVKDSADLVSMVSATAPGTTVPVRVVRDAKSLSINVKIAEVNVDADQPAAANGPRRAPGAEPPAAPEPKDTGFGMTVAPLTARQSRLIGGKAGVVVTDVDPSGAAGRAGFAPGDVIESINGKDVSGVDDMTKVLDTVRSGDSVRVLVWRSTGNGSGDDQFLMLRKH